MTGSDTTSVPFDYFVYSHHSPSVMEGPDTLSAAPTGGMR